MCKVLGLIPALHTHPLACEEIHIVISGYSEWETPHPRIPCLERNQGLECRASEFKGT